MPLTAKAGFKKKVLPQTKPFLIAFIHMTNETSLKPLKYTFCTPQNSFAPLSFISLYFKLPIPVKSGKMIWSSSNFQILFIVPIMITPITHVTVVSVKEW